MTTLAKRSPGRQMDDELGHRITDAAWRMLAEKPLAALTIIEIAESAGAALTVTTGDALLEENYPAVHAVGRAAAPHRAPRLIEIGWKLDRADLPLLSHNLPAEFAALRKLMMG
mgnify:CR=1 FL=1